MALMVTKQDFLAWAQTQPPEQPYDPTDCCHCALSRFAIAMELVTSGQLRGSQPGLPHVYIELTGTMLTNYYEFERPLFSDGFNPISFVAPGGRLGEDEETYYAARTIIVFEYGWVAIVQPDGTFEVARMD